MSEFLCEFERIMNGFIRKEKRIMLKIIHLNRNKVISIGKMEIFSQQRVANVFS